MHFPQLVQFRHVAARSVAATCILRFTVLLVFVFLAAPGAAQTFSILHSFSGRAGGPHAGLTPASDGKLYGTLSWGGLYGLGSIYVLTPDGLGGYAYSELHAATPSDGVEFLDTRVLAASDGRFYGIAGYRPSSGGIYRVDEAGDFELLHAFDYGTEGAQLGALIEVGGAFYGVARNGGGGPNVGTLFRMDTDGVVTVLHRFGEPEGGGPTGPLLAASDGFLYGTTSQGGANSLGSVFKSDLSGNVSVVHSLAEGEGSFAGALVEGDGGVLYGTSAGGAFGHGTVFRIDPSGTLSTLHEFTGDAGGSAPALALLRTSDDSLYGTTIVGGPAGQGTVFRIDAAGTFEIVHGLTFADGKWPYGTLIEADGQLLGTAWGDGDGGVGTVFAVDTAGEFEVVYSFRGSTEGSFPLGGLVQVSDGDLYGATWTGGDRGYGTIYRIDLVGNFALIHDFDGTTDGGNPQGGLLEGSDGALYGTASTGGTGMAGTVFRMDLSGSLTTLHSFTGLDGGIPSDVLAEGSDGRFYGATYAGGLSDYGTLFRVDSSGQFSLLHQFSGAEDGGHPLGGLLAASDGHVYGTTVGVPLDAGTLFRVDVSGGYEVLHEFAPFDPEGHGPVGTLLERSDGYLFGTTRQGGENGRGTVFRSDPQGEVRPLASLGSFDSGPSGGLVEDENGNLYGVQVGDPFTSRGAVFRVDTNGEYKVLHRFNGSDGWSPQARLVRANDGKLYGTAYGGEFAGGVVYRIDPAAIISLDGATPGSGPAAGGTSVHIFGSAFQAGASVSFGGTPGSSVIVVDSSEIVAVAPALFPGAAYDILVVNGDFLDATLPDAWVADPLDVPPSSLYYDAIVRMLGGLVSAGCGNGNYCPDAPVSRAQLAVLLLKAKLGPLYEPPFANGSVFVDVPWDSFAAAWIEDLASRGISAGCGFGKFCPDAPVTRAAMAPLLLKALLAASYTPPEATGGVFSDVPADSFAAAWIEALAIRGLSAGCSADPALYCPGAATTRGQLAAVLVHAFEISPAVVSGGPVR